MLGNGATEFAAGDWLRGPSGSISVVGDGSNFQREWVPDRLAGTPILLGLLFWFTHVRNYHFLRITA